MYVKRYLTILMVAVFLFVLPSQGLANIKEGIDDSVFNQFKDPKEQTEIPAEEKDISTGGQAEVSEHKPPSVSIFDFIKMMFALLFVLALLYGALKLINSKNKLSNGKISRKHRGTNLGNNKSLQLVKVGNSILVVGVGDSINLLKEITDDEEREQLLQSYRDRTENMPIQSDKISGLIEKFKEARTSKNQSRFSVMLQDQLGQLSKDRKKKMDDYDDKKELGR